MATDSISKSFFQKTVCLKDWWLVKTENDSEGKRLGVAGITSREKQAVRVFSSAPILRRHDVFTLESVDGLCIIINGFMNKARTEENGFPSEVCDHFIFGFPPYWGTYALNCFGREPPTVFTTPSITDSGQLFPQKGTAHEASEAVQSPADCLFENMKGVGTVVESTPGNIVSQSFVPPELDDNDVHLSEQNTLNDRQKDEGSSFPILRNSRTCKRKVALSPSHCKDNPSEELQSEPQSSFLTTKESSCEGSSMLNTAKDSGSRSTSRLPMTRAHDLGDVMIQRTPNSRSIDDNSGQKHRSPYTDKGMNDDQNRKRFSTRARQLQSEPQSSFLTTKETSCEESSMPNNAKDSGSRSTSRLPITRAHDLGDVMIQRTPNSRSIDDNSGQKHRIPYTDKGMNDDQNKKRFITRARQLHSSSRLFKAGNGKKNNVGTCSFSGKNSRESRRSRKGDESIVSPEFLDLKRSRSGRLLLPRLEFWRNQRAIYDVGRQITGIKDLQVNEPSKGSRSEPPGKKRHL